MNDLLNTLSHTPLPTILVVAGIVFWILAIAGSLAGKITIEPGKQKTAAVVGTTFIVLGLFLLFFAPPNPTPSEPIVATTETPKQTTGPSPAHTQPSPGVNCSGTGSPDEVEICPTSVYSFVVVSKPARAMVS